MAQFVYEHEPGRALTDLTLMVGQEARPVLWRGAGADAGVFSAIPTGLNGGLLMVADGLDISQQAAFRRFRVTGLKAGSYTIAMTPLHPGGGSPPPLGSLNVHVHAPGPGEADLVYWGKYLVWNKSLARALQGQAPLVFNATSGNVDYKTGKDWRNAKFHKLADAGPIEQAEYSFLADLDPRMASVAQANAAYQKLKNDVLNNHGPGIQFLPIQPANPATGSPAGPQYEGWGSMRVLLTPRSRITRPGGFFLHNSHKMFTHGCIEVGFEIETKIWFFDALLQFARERHGRYLRLKVNYSFPDVGTLGDTGP